MVFSTFHRRKKSAKIDPRSGSELSADFSSSTTSSGRMSLAACGCCCPLDAGTCSARTQKSSGMAQDMGMENDIG